MKLEFASVTLGDDSVGDFLLDGGAGNGAHQRVVQQEPLAGGTNVFTAARGNKSNQVTFIVSKEHASVAAAAEWWFEHPDLLATSGSLVLTEGASISTMTGAVLQSVERVNLTGRSTILRYTFVGGAITG
jgi:hypothetical protein